MQRANSPSSFCASPFSAGKSHTPERRIVMRDLEKTAARGFEVIVRTRPLLDKEPHQSPGEFKEISMTPEHKNYVSARSLSCSSIIPTKWAMENLTGRRVSNSTKCMRKAPKIKRSTRPALSLCSTLFSRASMPLFLPTELQDLGRPTPCSVGLLYSRRHPPPAPRKHRFDTARQKSGSVVFTGR